MSIEALKQQARKHEQAEDWQKALDQYNKALAELARDEQVDIGLYNRVGDLYVRVGNLDPAVEHYEKAVDLYREAYLPNNAIAVCKKIIRNVPERHRAYLIIGQIRAEQGFIPDARTNFLTYAERMQQAGDLDESYRALIEFCDLAPDDVGVRVTVADQMAASGRGEEAVEQYLIAYSRFNEIGESDQAKEVESKVLELDPDADLTAVPSGFGGSSISEDGEIVADFGEIGVGADAFGDSDESEVEFATESAMEEAAGDDSEGEESDFGGFAIDASDDGGEESAADFDDDEGEAVELPTMDFGDDEEEAAELPTMDFGDDTDASDEEEAAELPTMDFGDDADASDEEAPELPTMDFGEDAEEEAAELPTMDFDEGPVEQQEADPVVIPEIDFGGEDAESGEVEDVGLPGMEADDGAEEAPSFDVEADATDDPAAAFEEAAEEVASDDFAVEEAFVEVEAAEEVEVAEPADEAGPIEVAEAPAGEVPTAFDEPEAAAPAPTTDSGDGYVDLGAMILGNDEEKSTRFTVAYEEPTGDEEADFAKMLSQFKEKVSENLDSSDVRAHYDLGTAYKEMGLLDEAISSFQAALRASADHLPTYELMGQTFIEMGQPEAAVKSLERAIESADTVEDELVGIYYYLGRAYEALENNVSAVEFYDRVFALDINFADVTERLRELR